MNTTRAPHAGLLLAATALTFVVFIQPNSLAGNNEKKPPPPPPLQVEQMAQKMDVPFLPEFTGEHKFVSGIMHRSNNGPSCIMTFTSKEDGVRRSTQIKRGAASATSTCTGSPICVNGADR